jgi:hypothetical protein
MPRDWRPTGAAKGRGEGPVFGLTLTKILFTILVVIAVWKGFALVGRLARDRRQTEALRRRPGNRAAAASKRTIELVECPRCGAYVDPGEGCRCERGAN